MRARPRHEASRETGGLPYPALLVLAIVLLVALGVVALTVPGTLKSAAAQPPGSGPVRESTSPVADPTALPSPTTSAASAQPSVSVSASVKASLKPSPKATGATAIEDQVTTLVNAERKKAGCGALRTDERLRTAARAHSSDMVRFDYFAHDGHDGSSPGARMKAAGYPSSGWAENIAYGYRTAADVVKGWMNSPGHRANILNCGYKDTGVGLAYKGSTAYWTQDFGSA